MAKIVTDLNAKMEKLAARIDTNHTAIMGDLERVQKYQANANSRARTEQSHHLDTLSKQLQNLAREATSLHLADKMRTAADANAREASAITTKQVEAGEAHIAHVEHVLNETCAAHGAIIASMYADVLGSEMEDLINSVAHEPRIAQAVHDVAAEHGCEGELCVMSSIAALDKLESDSTDAVARMELAYVAADALIAAVNGYAPRRRQGRQNEDGYFLAHLSSNVLAKMSATLQSRYRNHDNLEPADQAGFEQVCSRKCTLCAQDAPNMPHMEKHCPLTYATQQEAQQKLDPRRIESMLTRLAQRLAAMTARQTPSTQA